MVRHPVYGCVFPVHDLKIPFSIQEINLIVVQNVVFHRAWLFAIRCKSLVYPPKRILSHIQLNARFYVPRITYGRPQYD